VSTPAANTVAVVTVPAAADVATIHARLRHIQEDIDAAEEKIVRIQSKIERDRHALAVWQMRLAGSQNENRPRQ
jgi:hypothetical protein